jgi:hypothetical protein
MRGDPRFEERQHDERRSMTTQESGRQGDWYGYVQPYRYYGPGYRGVGYYSVFYQGADPYRADETETDESRPRFDQRNVHYGQGQGAGAAWDDRRRWGGSDWTESPGAWRDRARQWGQFAGRGPKGYQRSDERIREDLSDRLMEHPDLDASDIDVQVANGIVTLTGGVESRWAKRLAEDIAEGVSGVRDVMNRLGVGGPSAETGSARGTRGTTTATASSRQPRNGRRPATANR